MSYYPMSYSMTNPGTPGWQFAPSEGWGMNPMAAGPRRVGVGALGCGCGVGAEEDAYKQTSWGIVAAATAGGLLVGLLIGYAAGKRGTMRANRSKVTRLPKGRIRGVRGRALTAPGRRRLPDSAFALPESRSFPINDEYHAIKALQYAKWPQHKSRRASVLSAVGRKYGHDPEVAERAYKYFPQSASRYGFSRAAARKAA